MQKVNVALWQILLGVGVGITLGLALTLRYWGDAWWQITIAIMGGIIAGLFSTSPTGAFYIFKEVFQKTENFISESVEIDKDFFDHFLLGKILRSILFVASIALFWTAFSCLINFFLEGKIFVDLSMFNLPLGGKAVYGVASFLFWFFFFLSVWFRPYEKWIPKKIAEKVWHVSEGEIMVYKGEIFTDRITMPLTRMAREIGIYKTELKLLQTNMYLFPYSLKRIAECFWGVLVCIATLFIMLITLIVLIPPWAIQGLYRSNWGLTVAISVTVGILVGIFYRPSFGYIFGFGVTLTSWALDKFVESSIKISFAWENKYVKSIGIYSDRCLLPK